MPYPYPGAWSGGMNGPMAGGFNPNQGGLLQSSQTSSAGPMAPPPQGYQPMGQMMPQGGSMMGQQPGQDMWRAAHSPQGYTNPMIGNALRGMPMPIQYASRAGRMRNAGRHAALDARTGF